MYLRWCVCLSVCVAGRVSVRRLGGEDILDAGVYSSSSSSSGPMQFIVPAVRVYGRNY